MNFNKKNIALAVYVIRTDEVPTYYTCVDNLYINSLLPLFCIVMLHCPPSSQSVLFVHPPWPVQWRLRVTLYLLLSMAFPSLRDLSTCPSVGGSQDSTVPVAGLILLILMASPCYRTRSGNNWLLLSLYQHSHPLLNTTRPAPLTGAPVLCLNLSMIPHYCPGNLMLVVCYAHIYPK